jgi:basic membrane protein A
MRNRTWFVAFALLALAMLAGACGPTPAATPAAPGAAKLKVGLVTDVGKVDDKSFNQSSWEGVQCAQKDLALDASTTKYLETSDPKDYDKNIAQFADQKYDVIVSVGFALGEATYQAAKKYPNTMFIGVDQFQANDKDHPDIPLKNYAGLIFDEDKAGYLAGALAAYMSTSNKIGAVLGTDVVPPVWRFGEGYRAGAKATKSNIEVTIVYHNDVGFDKTFTDPEWGKTTALSMMDKGADVIFGAGGKTGNGALLGVAEKGKYGIGVDTDQYLTVPEAQKALLSSAMKLLTPGVCDLIKGVANKSFKGGNITGQVGLAPFHDLDSKVPADVKTKLTQLKADLESGKVKTGVSPAKP